MTRAKGTRRRSVRCSLGLHDWHTMYNDAHEPYYECFRCGNVDDYMPISLPQM